MVLIFPKKFYKSDSNSSNIKFILELRKLKISDKINIFKVFKNYFGELNGNIFRIRC